MAFLPRGSLQTSKGAPVRWAATLGLVPLGLLGGYAIGRFLRAPIAPVPLPPALDGAVETLDLPFGTLSYYRGGRMEAAPLLLVHGVGAAASAYEMKPLYDHHARTRAVYALDLPGFGLSDRPDRIYTPRLMADAILSLVDEVRRRHGPFPLDAAALSAGCEFLARAASERPTLFRTLAFISPSGIRSGQDGEGPPGSTYGRPALRDLISFPLWAPGLFRALVSRASLRFTLAKAWRPAPVDRDLLAYGYKSAHQRGAEHAPISVLAGFLSSADAMNLYRSLTGPVWMARGSRVRRLNDAWDREVAGRANWTIHIFDAGAMIPFEQGPAFLQAYGAFLDRVT